MDKKEKVTVTKYKARVNDEYFIFENNNKYSRGKFNISQALDAYITLKNCKDCIDCINCEDCNQCEKLTNKVNYSFNKQS